MAVHRRHHHHQRGGSRGLGGGGRSGATPRLPPSRRPFETLDASRMLATFQAEGRSLVPPAGITLTFHAAESERAAFRLAGRGCRAPITRTLWAGPPAPLGSSSAPVSSLRHGERRRLGASPSRLLPASRGPPTRPPFPIVGSSPEAEAPPPRRRFLPKQNPRRGAERAIKHPSPLGPFFSPVSGRLVFIPFIRQVEPKQSSKHTDITKC